VKITFFLIVIAWLVRDVLDPKWIFQFKKRWRDGISDILSNCNL